MLYGLFSGSAVLVMVLLVGGKSLFAAVGLDPSLAGTLAATLATVVSAALVGAFARYGIDWE